MVRTSRRTFLCRVGGALAALATSAHAESDSRLPSEPIVGIATLGFGNHTNAQLADELARHDFDLIQLFLNQSDSRYWRYNGRTDLSGLTGKRCKAIAETYRAAGISLHSLGVYTNLIHPDEDERRANLDYFDAMMRVGGDMGVRTFVTEAGHYHPDGPAPRVAYHFQEPVWDRMVATGKRLADLAERHNAMVLLEPFFRGFLASAKRTRVFLEEVDSPRIRALLDPANLLEVNDLETMFDQLTPWIECLHAKDRKLHVDRGVPAGQGDLDYPKFAALALERTPQAPLILEYVGPNDYLQAREHLRRALTQVTGRTKGNSPK